MSALRRAAKQRLPVTCGHAVHVLDVTITPDVDHRPRGLPRTEEGSPRRGAMKRGYRYNPEIGMSRDIR